MSQIESYAMPAAMGVSEQLGRLPSLIAVLVILIGIAGAMFSPLILDLPRIRDWSVRGMAIDTASHGIGTSRAMQVNELAGASAGLAMGLNTLATAILLPLIWKLLSRHKVSEHMHGRLYSYFIVCVMYPLSHEHQLESDQYTLAAHRLH